MKISRPSLRTRLVLQPSLLALAVASCFPGTGALANPYDPTTTNGSAVFQQHGSTLTIFNSPNAIINWHSFSIGVGEITRFTQQSSASYCNAKHFGQFRRRLRTSSLLQRNAGQRSEKQRIPPRIRQEKTG